MPWTNSSPVRAQAKGILLLFTTTATSTLILHSIPSFNFCFISTSTTSSSSSSTTQFFLFPNLSKKHLVVLVWSIFVSLLKFLVHFCGYSFPCLMPGVASCSGVVVYKPSSPIFVFHEVVSLIVCKHITFACTRRACINLFP